MSALDRAPPPSVPFREAAEGLAVHGTLHTAPGGAGDGLVLTHGAGSSSDEPAPRRAGRGAGSPGRRGASLRPALSPGASARAAVAGRRRPRPRRAPGRRPRRWRAPVSTASGSAVTPTADVRRPSSRRKSRALAHALLLLAYPLHPPGRPGELRVAHFPRLQTPALFVHGTTDPFGSETELRRALVSIPAPTVLHLEPGVGHDLGASRRLARRAAGAGQRASRPDGSSSSA